MFAHLKITELRPYCFSGVFRRLSPKIALLGVSLVLAVIPQHRSLGQSPLQISVAQLSFGNKTELSFDTLGVWVTNTDTVLLNCRATCLPYYGGNPFRTADTVFALSAGQSKRVVISFTPFHNTLNNSELWISHSGRGGHARVDLTGQGVYSNIYYNPTQNLEGELLRQALATRMSSPYTSLGYSGSNNARLRMFGTVDNWKVNGREPAHPNPYKNECVYSGRTISYTAADFNTGTLNNAPYSMNTEHTWPQSFMGSAEPMQSDMHHMFVSDGGLNAARGNKPFGWVPNPTLTYSGGSKANSIWFEPRDAHKGSVSRAILYFALRHSANSAVNLGFLDSAQQRMLREWVHLFPSDSVARRRNNDIQTAQGNRNALVDYPQLLDRLTTVLPPSSTPAVRDARISETSIQLGVVTAGSIQSHCLWVFNGGNQPLQVSGLSISGTGIEFGPGGGTSLPNFTVAPGECTGIILRNTSTLIPGNTYNATCSLSLEYSGQPAVLYAVPIQVRSANLVSQSTLGGSLKYENTSQSPLAGVTLRLLDSQGNSIGQTITDAQGNYNFSNIPSGTYTLDWINPLAWSGVGANDALLITRAFSSLTTLNGVKIKAADANLSQTINSSDALQVSRRFAGLIGSFTAGNWVYSIGSMTLTAGPNHLTVYALCTGDVNASRGF
jgi:hypothetical protein